MRLYPFGALALTLLLGGCTDPAPTAEQLAESRLGEILPRYQTLATAGQRLADESVAYCQEQATITPAQTAWRQGMRAWLASEAIAFGPITEANRSWTLEFWPDKRNLTQQKVERWLQQGSLDTEALKHASVVVKGFSALEYLLFTEEKLPEPNSLRCQGLVLIAQGLADNLKELERDWQSATLQQGWRALADDPSGQLLEETLLYGIGNSLDRAHKKLSLPLGKKRARPYLGQSWRSRDALAQLHASLAGADSLWRGGTHSLADWSQAQGADETVNRINNQFDRLYTQLEPLGPSLFELLSEPERRAEIQALAAEVKQLEQLFIQALQPALGVMPRFNASDGD